MNAWWIFAAIIYGIVAVALLIDEHRCGSGWVGKIASLLWLPTLIAALFITICQDVFEDVLR